MNSCGLPLGETTNLFMIFCVEAGVKGGLFSSVVDSSDCIFYLCSDDYLVCFRDASKRVTC